MKNYELKLMDNKYYKFKTLPNLIHKRKQRQTEKEEKPKQSVCFNKINVFWEFKQGIRMDKYSQGNKFKKKLTSSRRMSKTKQDIYKMESKDLKTLRLCEQMRGSEKT